MLKIGITAGILPPSTQRNVYKKKTLCYAEKDLANYWASFGVLPVIIPDLDAEFLPSFLAELDGLCLQGGTDISPQYYNQKAIAPWFGDSIRDSYEWQVLDLFAKQNKPIFGICRGFQLLNVYFGGTLYQDLPSLWGKKVAHRDNDNYAIHKHRISVVKGELFEDLTVCQKSNLVNSIHHQGIHKLADDLTALAHSEDGLIEAFYHNKQPKGKIMGVQWHPEFDYQSTQPLIENKAIIKHFLTFCKQDNLSFLG